MSSFYFLLSHELAEELNDIVSKDYDLRLEPEDLASATGTESKESNPAEKSSSKKTSKSDASPKKRAPAKKAAKQFGEGSNKRERNVVQVAEEIKHFSRIANAVCYLD